MNSMAGGVGWCTAGVGWCTAGAGWCTAGAIVAGGTYRGVSRTGTNWLDSVGANFTPESLSMLQNGRTIRFIVDEKYPIMNFVRQSNIVMSRNEATYLNIFINCQNKK
jgi:hypothetical protein